jgi:hypothetical protein
VDERSRSSFPRLERYFALDMPFWRFARNTLVVSCLSLIPLLLIYVALTPGFGTMLLQGGPAFSRFLRQVVTNGLPVVFAVNYVSFFLYATMVARGRGSWTPAIVLLIDLPTRIVVFVVLHGIIYVAAANWFGSFGGDSWQALRVVGPTLVRSALLENISGVYLYATLASAVPLYVAALDRIIEAHPEWAPAMRRIGFLRAGTPSATAGRIIVALMLFVAFALVLTAVAALIVRLQRMGM